MKELREQLPCTMEILMYYELPAYKVFAYRSHGSARRRYNGSEDSEIEDGMLIADTAYNQQETEA